MNDPENIARYCAEQTHAMLYNLRPDVIARRKAKQHAIENCPYVEFEQDMEGKIPFCKMTGELCDCQCDREKRWNGMGLTERHLFENEDVPENYEWALEDAVSNSCANKKNEEREREPGGIDYKKAFKLLMVTMIAKTLSPSGNNFGYGSPDVCIECMAKGRNFAYGDDGDKKLVCDKCPYNFTNVFRTKQMKGSEVG